MGKDNDIHLIQMRPRPDTLYGSQGRVAFATQRDGMLEPSSEHGLMVHKTRMLSSYRYLIDGNRLYPAMSSNVQQHSWMGYYITTAPGVATGPKDEATGQLKPDTQHTLELILRRFVGPGIHEDVDLTNYTQEQTTFTLELEIDSDFADQNERDKPEKKRELDGKLRKEWREAGNGTCEFLPDFHATHNYEERGRTGSAAIHRSLSLCVENADSPPTYKHGRIRFEITLPPHGAWHTCIRMTLMVDGQVMPSPSECWSFDAERSDFDRLRNLYLSEATHFEAPTTHTLTHVVIGALEQAKQDLASLRLYDFDHGERAWVPAAGLPIYISLYGRDTLTASWQAALAGPEMMIGTLAELPNWQGTEVNDWRDEQPGKMIHEAQTSPREALNYSPYARYYGSITTSGLYSFLLSELWHWTGDKELVSQFVEPALKGLRWLEEYSDLDGDGFYEYLTRSPMGLRHQAWKDSWDAIVYDDGRLAEPPIETCEEQAFIYVAKLHLSEVLWWLDRKDEAKHLYEEAGVLKKRFNEAFWMEDEGSFAMGLDPNNQQIKAIGSNAGHCIAAGIVEEDYVTRTVDRLFAPDMFTGWGIRTLSSENPAYNPYSYHRGTVWPVEHGTFAIGFLRYGLHERTQQISRAMFEAASLFDFYRLPELFSGHQRDDAHPLPSLYPQSCSPQAWSSSPIFSFVQSMLGLYPYAPLNMLLIDPHLPEWLPEITLRNLRVGKAVTTIRFYRKDNGDSSYEILDEQGPLHVIRQPSPWSLTASFGERLKDMLTSFLPGN
jgi:glycogen debranching enzyme